jgi:hypothetical protein
MKGIAALLFCSIAASAQTSPPVPASPPDPPELESSGSPMAIPFTCNPDDLQWAGLACDEAPCPIYVDLAQAAGQGKTILVTGNFHAAAATLNSLLLRTDDGGHTWREPYARARGTELDHVQMYDAKTAWISGQVVQPLALDPFFLITGDGGKTWERIALFEEGTPGSILQFLFETRDHGFALVDHGGGLKRYEVYETQSGGREWSSHEQSDTLPKLKSERETQWRVRAEPKLFRLQHLEEEHWKPFASFSVHVATCTEGK